MSIFELFFSKKTKDNSTSGKQQKLDKENAFKQVKKFQEDSINLVVKHLHHVFMENPPLLREVKYLLHYTFAVLQDDYFLGKKILYKNITKIDDYIFSQYRKDKLLQKHIQALAKMGYTKRFLDKPKENLRAYFVMIEENNFEIMLLLEDFCLLLEAIENNPQAIMEYRKSYSLENYRGGEDQNATRQTQSPHSFFTAEYTFLPNQQVRKQIIEEEIIREIKK